MSATLDHLPTESDERELQERLDAARTKIENLEIALESSRVIGIAVGIVVERCRLSAGQAFDALVRVSQSEHRKLRDVASDLVFTGVVPPTRTAERTTRR